MTYVAVIAGLVALVFIHELGHFSVAMAVRMRPRSFYIGFPPALVKVKRRGIEYGIGAIPLGGFVRLPGMHRPAARDLQIGLGPAIEEQPSLGPAVLRVRRALDIENYELARAAYVELEREVAAASLSAAARRSASRGLRDVDEGTALDAYWRAPTWKRISVIIAGPAANLVAAFVILFIVFTSGGAPTDRGTSTVAAVESNTPAATAGLHPNDRIVAVNGTPAATFAAISHLIRSSRGGPVKVTVIRDGKRVTLGPESTIFSDHRWIWGFSPAAQLTTLPAGRAATTAGSDLWEITSGTASGLASFIHPHHHAQFTTVVGITRQSAAALRVGPTWYFQTLAFVSVSLALLNMIPLLPLDGGHILFSLIESVRRRALAREVYERVSFIGLALLLLVFLIAFSSNPTGAVGH
jgi:regulator of sigma E protease